MPPLITVMYCAWYCNCWLIIFHEVLNLLTSDSFIFSDSNVIRYCSNLLLLDNVISKHCTGPKPSIYNVFWAMNTLFHQELANDIWITQHYNGHIKHSVTPYSHVYTSTFLQNLLYKLKPLCCPSHHCGCTNSLAVCPSTVHLMTSWHFTVQWCNYQVLCVPFIC